jgi:hypothetical protein
MSEVSIVIPDFEDMVKVANAIRDQMIVRNELDSQIKQRESEIYQITSTDQKYFTKGNPPSATFVKSAYEYTGLEGELVPLRKAFENAKAEIAFQQNLFDIMKMQVDLYRTNSANQRSTSL